MIFGASAHEHASVNKPHQRRFQSATRTTTDSTARAAACTTPKFDGKYLISEDNICIARTEELGHLKPPPRQPYCSIRLSAQFRTVVEPKMRSPYLVVKVAM